jgi:hypothetical protein
MTVDVVAAWFNEDLGWAKSLPGECFLYAYNKGDGGSLPNVGREAHTYLHHIVKHYAMLADWTFFCQGDPTPHCPDFCAIVNGWPASHRKSALYVSPELMFFSNHPVLFYEPQSQGDDALNDCAGLWSELFVSPMPERIVFAPGAIFAISRDKLLSRSKAFYQAALELAVSRPRGPWEFERIWAYLWISSAATKL